MTWHGVCISKSIMKKVECIVPMKKFTELEKALREFGIHGMTVTEVRGYGTLHRLPESGAEVRSIAALFEPGETVVLVRQEAIPAELRQALAHADGRLAALHLACHGVVDVRRPWLTGLVLAGRPLRARA